MSSSTPAPTPTPDASLYTLCTSKRWDQALHLISNNNNKNAISYVDPATGRGVLHVAVEKQAPLEVVRKLLDLKLSPNAKAKDGMTPLFVAVDTRANNTEVLKLLCEYGGDANVVVNGVIDGRTPVLTATYTDCSVKFLKLLLDHGGGANVADKNGVTPVFVACQTNVKAELLQLLLDRGGDPRQPRHDGFTPCYIAAEKNVSPKLMEVLLKAGGDADLNEWCVNGATAMYIAAQKNVDPALMRVMVKYGGNPNQHTIHFGTALQVAIQTNAKPELVRIMLDAGGDIQGDADRASLAYIAAANNVSVELMNLLLSRGADPNDRGVVEQTPVFRAVAKGVSAPLLKALLDAGGDPNIPHKDGLTILAVACSEGPRARKENIALLLEYGADPNQVAYADGMTALHSAIQLDVSRDIIKLLLEYGADPLARMGSGDISFSCVDFAVHSDKPEIAKILMAPPATRRKGIRRLPNRFALGDVQARCANCSKPGGGTDHQPLRKCKCLMVWYCDAQCAAANWPEHKVTCNEARRGKGTQGTAGG